MGQVSLRLNQGSFIECATQVFVSKFPPKRQMPALLPKGDITRLFHIFAPYSKFTSSVRFEIGILAAGMLELENAAVLAHSSHPCIHNAWFARS